jgi:hypothetical protein
MRGTEAVKDSGFGVIQIRQPQNDFVRRRFPALLGHARGLHAADMQGRAISLLESFRHLGVILL